MRGTRTVRAFPDDWSLSVRRTPRKTLLAAALLVGATAPAVSLAASPAHLALETATPSLPIDGYDGTYFLGDLGVYLTNRGGSPFEVQVTRATYGSPIRAFLATRDDDHRLVRTPLPAGIVTGFAGFARLGHVTITDDAGVVVSDQDIGTCIGGGAQRLAVDSNGASAYPAMCGGGNPFTLGAAWGVDAGWAATLDASSATFVGVSGTYHAHVALDDATAAAIGVAPADRAADIDLIGTMQTTLPGVGKVPHAASKGHRLPRGLRRYTHRAGTAQPATDTLPDLIALPAWGMSTSSDAGRDFLNFGANVWNAGPAQLAVEGFRRKGTDVMDAYQLFSRNGKQVGYAATGTMEFDRRPGHNHWHFEDFAQYDLLAASGAGIVRSGKQSFCIAPTDGIDLLRPGAVMNPWLVGLGSACGWSSALWIREAMPVGWGDTYFQYKSGQAFDVTDVSNGTYAVRVTANPGGRLFERTRANDTSLRTVILGGVPGARTVTVPPYMGIDTDPALTVG